MEPVPEGEGPGPSCAFIHRPSSTLGRLLGELAVSGALSSQSSPFSKRRLSWLDSLPSSPHGASASRIPADGATGRLSREKEVVCTMPWTQGLGVEHQGKGWVGEKQAWGPGLEAFNLG